MPRNEARTYRHIEVVPASGSLGAEIRGVDLRAVGDIGGERQVCLGRFEVDGRDPEAVFAEPLGDG